MLVAILKFLKFAPRPHWEWASDLQPYWKVVFGLLSQCLCWTESAVSASGLNFKFIFLAHSFGHRKKENKLFFVTDNLLNWKQKLMAVCLAQLLSRFKPCSAKIWISCLTYFSTKANSAFHPCEVGKEYQHMLEAKCKYLLKLVTIILCIKIFTIIIILPVKIWEICRLS